MDRRAFLSNVAAASTALSAPATSGCLGDRGVTVLSAGSLSVVLDDVVGPRFERATGTSFAGEYYGTNAVIRMVQEGQKNPDVVVSADVDLLRDRLYPEHVDWDVVFASNSVVIAYDPRTELGSRLEDGDPWYHVLEDAEQGEVAISDPDLDPLGYRAIQMFELAERKHELDGFRSEMASKVYTEPQEPQLLGGVRSGNRAAAVAYRNMAVDHEIEYVELPPDLDFSDPSKADHYASATYTTEEGYVTEGSAVLYTISVNRNADDPEAAYDFVEHLLDDRDVLDDHGLTLPELRYEGDVPTEVRQ